MAHIIIDIMSNHLTTKSIIDFIGEGKQVTGWLQDGSMNRDEFRTELQSSLQKVHDQMVEMKQTLSEIGVQINWEHLNTRICSAEMDICHKFELLQSILSIKGSGERKAELERLRQGILDANTGVLQSLSVIHQVLEGHALVNHTEEGLLELWSNAIYENMIEKLWPAKKYHDLIMNYLQKVVILQFKGFLLFAGANEVGKEFCMIQISLLKEHLKLQERLVENKIPESTKYLVDLNYEREFTLNFLPGSAYQIDLDKAKWKFEMTLSSARQNKLCITTCRSETSDDKYCLRYSCYTEDSPQLELESYSKKYSLGLNVTPHFSPHGDEQIIISFDRTRVLHRNSKFQSDMVDRVFTMGKPK